MWCPLALALLIHTPPLYYTHTRSGKSPGLFYGITWTGGKYFVFLQSRKNVILVIMASGFVVLLVIIIVAIAVNSGNESDAYKKGLRDGESQGFFDGGNDMIFDDRAKKKKGMTEKELKDYKRGYEEAYRYQYEERKKRK